MPGITRPLTHTHTVKQCEATLVFFKHSIALYRETQQERRSELIKDSRATKGKLLLSLLPSITIDGVSNLKVQADISTGSTDSSKITTESNNRSNIIISDNFVIRSAI